MPRSASHLVTAWRETLSFFAISCCVRPAAVRPARIFCPRVMSLLSSLSAASPTPFRR